MEPLISVIVPVYKVEMLLSRCIDSILDQTYRNLDIILVDDGSPDGCGRICDEYAQKDPRIRVFHQNNRGQGAARNVGLENAKGMYIGFVDSDDWIAPDMYEILLNCLVKENADVALCGRYLELESSEKVPMFHYPQTQIFSSHEAVRRFLLSDGLDAATWDKLYTKEIFSNIQYPSSYVAEDMPVTSQLLAAANKVVHCGKPLYYYFQRNGSLSRSDYHEKSAGLYYFSKEVQLRMTEKFPDLREEGEYYYYKNLLIFLFLYTRYEGKDSVGEEAVGQLRKNILGICTNRYLKWKYKMFALGYCVGLEKIAVRLSEKYGINNRKIR